MVFACCDFVFARDYPVVVVAPTVAVRRRAFQKENCTPWGFA